MFSVVVVVTSWYSAQLQIPNFKLKTKPQPKFFNLCEISKKTLTKKFKYHSMKGSSPKIEIMKTVLYFPTQRPKMKRTFVIGLPYEVVPTIKPCFSPCHRLDVVDLSFSNSYETLVIQGQ